MLDISLLIAVLLAQADTRHPEDACLRTIVQVGATIWAAGDEGTLLSSRDAGKTWEKQPFKAPAIRAGVMTAKVSW